MRCRLIVSDDVKKSLTKKQSENAIGGDLTNNRSTKFTKTLLKNSESDNTADSRNINFSVQETK